MPVPAGSDPNNAPMFLYNVTTTDAICSSSRFLQRLNLLIVAWLFAGFYCAQGPHCSLGMVGAVNAKEDGPKSFDAFKAKAMATAGNNTGSGPTVSCIATTRPLGSWLILFGILDSMPCLVTFLRCLPRPPS